MFQAYTTYNLHFKQTFKKYFHLFGYFYKYFGKKTTKFKYKNTTPGEQKGEAIVHSVQQPLNLILYTSQFRSI